MTPSRKTLHRWAMVAGGALLVVLTVSLGLRVHAMSGSQAPAAVVVAPTPLPPTLLEIPEWSNNRAREWPLRYRTNLDYLAPLGDGPGNAAAWFKDFRKPAGKRYDEAVAMRERLSEHPELGKHVPGDDPLLLEAEPWVDQATMAFYPDLLPVSGYSTEIPNLLFALHLARSWAVRGASAEDDAAAMEDFRRVVRLGRLLRQEDTVVISDLVGLACIRIGAEMIYERAERTGDTKLALAAAIVVGETAPQRLLTLHRLTQQDIGPFVSQNAEGQWTLDLPDSLLEALLERARQDPDRRFRLEAIISLNLVNALGRQEQKAMLRPLLEELAASEDAVIAKTARWSRDTVPSDKYIAEHTHPPWE